LTADDKALVKSSRRRPERRPTHGATHPSGRQFEDSERTARFAVTPEQSDRQRRFDRTWLQRSTARDWEPAFFGSPQSSLGRYRISPVHGVAWGNDDE
jgi:hypothetical protein